VTEKVVVEALKFDMIVELPYCHLLKFIKLLQGKLTVAQLITSTRLTRNPKIVPIGRKGTSGQIREI